MVCQNRCFKVIGDFFGKYGRFVSRYPWWFIYVPFIIYGLCGIGLIQLSYESDLETLYVPVNSQSETDRNEVSNLFRDTSDSNFYLQNLAFINMYGDLLITAKEGRDVLSAEAIQEIQSILLDIKRFVIIESNGSMLNYSSLCAIRDGQCLISGEFLLESEFTTDFSKQNITFPIWIKGDGTFIDLSQSISGTIQNGFLISANAIKIVFNLRQTDIALSKKWEQNFVQEMNRISTNYTELSYSTSTSLDDELASNTSQDVQWFALSFTLLITYASFVASSGNCVASRGHLARGGVIGVGLSILASFGLCSIGLPFVNIVGIMPFLVLGVGVDSIFIIMSEWTDHYGEETVADQMEVTMRKCGGSVSLACLTNVLTFLIGISSSFTSIRIFCAYTAVALFFSFIGHLTFFLGCLAVHGQRVRNNRHCITCRKIKDDSRMKEIWKSPTKRAEDESLCEKIPQMILRIPLSTMSIRFLQMLILITYLGYLGVSVWGILNLKEGLVLGNLVDENSYYKSYEKLSIDNFEKVFPISIIVKDMDYLNSQQVNSRKNLLEQVEKDSKIENDSLLCWYSQYRTSSFYNDTNVEAFVFSLKTFLQNRPHLQNDITFGKDNLTIVASRCHFVTVHLSDTTEQGALMLRLRDLTATSDMNVFVYSSAFIFFEQYVAILPSTLQTLGIAVASMFVVTALFIPNPILIVLVTLNMISILVGILGMLYFWDLSLSSISMIHLIMSVGFSVDFSAHVCHGFLASEAETRNLRTRDALRVSAAPILNGGISSLIGICTLWASQSYVFRSFFKIMVLVLSFGLAHSMLLLPAILSLIGPPKVADDKKKNIISIQKEISTSKIDMEPGERNTTEIFQYSNDIFFVKE